MHKRALATALSTFWLAAGLAPAALAQPAAPGAIDPGDTAFMLVCSALVMLMTPGLAFFYGGLVRARNVLNTMMMSFIAMAVVGVTWLLWGYSLAFAPASAAANPWIGGLQWCFGAGVGLTPDPVGYAPTIPHQLFMIYQMMFAIITVALVSGAIVERVSFKAFFWFILLWSTLVYAPLAHWVWGKGWLASTGALDFAGGTVVHISSGVSALVAAWMIGPREQGPDTPHNVPFVFLGAGLLWFGWFGFNAGSAVASGTLATVAFVTTMVAAAAAGLAWAVLEWQVKGKPTAIGLATGFVSGLVGITPAAGYVTPLAALAIGALTAGVCFAATAYMARNQVDDSLEAFPVHGIGGTVGALLTGVFASKAINGAGSDGLLYGNATQLLHQATAVGAAWALAAVGTLAILWLLSQFMDLKVHSDIQQQGLDLHEHGQEAYPIHPGKPAGQTA